NVSLSPTMQIIRDPRGGRNFESFSEDPFLSAQLAASAVTGIQSNNIIATAKHYVNNDHETNRDTIIVNVDDRTQHEVYLAPFKAAVDAGVGAFMCSYNKIATPTGSDWACENSYVLKTLLKGELGFRGFVMSDWGATHSGAKAANAGLDVEMNNNLWFLNLDGQITDATAREMARRIVFAHLVTNLDDFPATKVTKAQGVETRVVSTAANRDTAQRTAEQSIVLLKNTAVGGVPLLPLSKTNRNVAVFGQCAETNHVFQGKGSAEGLTTGKTIMTPRQAIANALGVSASTIPYGTEANIDSAVSLATGKAAAIVVLCATSMEGYGDGGDRGGLNFGAARSFSNANSDALATRIAATGTPTVVMVVSPAQMTMPWASSVRAILWSSLLGEMQAPAIARVLFGDVNPSGKLPLTFGASLSDYPTASSVYGSTSDMFPGNGTSVWYREGLFVGYRHFDARNIAPLFPFGHGLSYTTFTYANLSVTPSVNAQANEAVTVSLDLTNSGAVAGAEVVQVYLGFPSTAGEPPKVLKGFQKVSLTPGQTQRVAVTLAPESYKYWSNGWVPALGTFQVMVGSSSRDIRLTGAFDVSNGTPTNYTFTVTKAGTGTGTVTSSPVGISCGATCSANFASGTAVTLTATAATGSWFAGWSGACTGSAATCVVTMNAARALTATFNAFPPDGTLTVTKSGTGSGTVTGGGINCGSVCIWVQPGDTVVNLTATAATGSVFVGWSGACTGTAPTCAVMGGADRLVNAQFDLGDVGTYPLTITKSGTGGGTFSFSPPGTDCTSGTRCFPAGTIVTVTAIPAAGSMFAGWSGSCTGTGPCTLTMSQARTLNATFNTLPPDGVLTVTRSGTGTGTVTGGNGIINCGTVCSTTLPGDVAIVLTATASPGSVFAGWSGVCTGTASTCTVFGGGDRLVDARFDPVATTYPLTISLSGTSGTVSTSPPGTACGTGARCFPAGTIVTLTATPGSGSTFAGWSGACTGTALTCTVTMSGARSVIATFTGTGTSTLLSQGKPATASSTESASYPASSAVDASTTTRWSSQFSDPQWIRVDLGQRATIDRVVLRWEAAYGRAYQIQTSDDGTTWTSIYSTTTSTGGLQTLAVSGAGRYVRMYGTARGTSYGYSLYDFQVWGAFGQTTNRVLGVSKLGSGAGTVSSTPAGIACGATCSASFASGTLVTLTATPADASSMFMEWGGACSGSGACVVTMSADQSVTATFSTVVGDVMLSVTKSGNGSGTVTSTPSGINCGPTCTAPYSTTAVVTLTATPAAGSTFSGWTGACTGTTPTCVIPMTLNRTVDAAFTVPVIENDLTVVKAGVGTGTVTGTGGINCGTSCSAPYAYGAVVTLTVAASSGSTFLGWSGACTGTSGTCIVTMNGSRSVTATFGLSDPTPCANPVTFTSNTGNFNTTGAVCYRTAQRVNGWGCSNFAGRTVSVNGGPATATCGAGPFPLAQMGGYTYFTVTAGSYPWASIYIW
ncbi:MAG TPA: glycoside hydrolase family 3 C-terminal domain-containing protein, partial [Anaeromyxobacter sp.]|nr:glycoside hydrolase family 3 C-terminal domain-containing protein [Anaeromyxobacter sp.]